MNDELEFIFNTRHSSNFGTDFYTRIAEALANDLEHERANEEAGQHEEDDPLDENDEDYLPNEDDASDVENDLLIEPNVEDDSDEEEEDCGSEIGEENNNGFIGKDGTIWHKNQPNNGVRTRQHNVMRFRAGPKEQISTPLEVFKKFFTPNITDIIIFQTNRYGRDAVNKWNAANVNKKPRVWKNLTEDELYAFIGILLAMGVSHNNMQNPRILWRTDNLPIFRAATSLHRFISLTRYIRFDDGRTR